MLDAHAFWLRAPGHGEIRPVVLPEPGRDAWWSHGALGVSRGARCSVFRGVPPSLYAAMRAPFRKGTSRRRLVQLPSTSAPSVGAA